MPTITPEEETLIQWALKGVRDGKFPNFKVVSRHYKCNHDVLRTRAKGIQGNWSRGGKNKRLIGEEEAALIHYYKRRILYNDPLDREYIVATANSILRAAGKKRVSKP
jgi:hypothetical protein